MQKIARPVASVGIIPSHRIVLRDFYGKCSFGVSDEVCQQIERGQGDEHVVNAINFALRGNPTGSFCVDLGANVCQFTAMMAAAGCNVVAVEPQPPMLLYCTATILANNWHSQVTLLGVGVSDTDGEAVLRTLYAPGGTKHNRFSTGGLKSRVVALERILPTFTRLLKVDVDGPEIFALRALVPLLNRRSHVVLNIIAELSFNVWPSYGVSDNESLALLTTFYDLNYTLFLVNWPFDCLGISPLRALNFTHNIFPISREKFTDVMLLRNHAIKNVVFSKEVDANGKVQEHVNCPTSANTLLENVVIVLSITDDDLLSDVLGLTVALWLRLGVLRVDIVALGQDGFVESRRWWNLLTLHERQRVSILYYEMIVAWAKSLPGVVRYAHCMTAHDDAIYVISDADLLPISSQYLSMLVATAKLRPAELVVDWDYPHLHERCRLQPHACSGLPRYRSCYVIGTSEAWSRVAGEGMRNMTFTMLLQKWYSVSWWNFVYGTAVRGEIMSNWFGQYNNFDELSFGKLAQLCKSCLVLRRRDHRNHTMLGDTFDGVSLHTSEIARMHDCDLLRSTDFHVSRVELLRYGQRLVFGVVRRIVARVLSNPWQQFIDLLIEPAS